MGRCSGRGCDMGIVIPFRPAQADQSKPRKETTAEREKRELRERVHRALLEKAKKLDW